MASDQVIVSNQVECLKCGDRPYSAHRHDFKSCRCGNVCVDGGDAYLKRMYRDRAYARDLSIVLDKDVAERMIANVEEAIERGCNPRGLVYTVLRDVRDNNLLKEN